MRSNTCGASILSLLAALAVPVAAQEAAYFTLGTGMPVVLERVDPLLSAGKISNHVHSVVGGNGFAPIMDFAQTQTSDCSTVRVKADKSNYWMPALYYKSPHNGSFIRVPEKPYHKIYYKYGTGDSIPDLERSEFPKEFRMLTGNAMLRSLDVSHDVGGNELNWNCHGPDPKPLPGFPKFTSCNGGGLAATIRFPSCWNGQDFDPAKPHAHMDFPSAQSGMAGCTAPYNIKRFPEIMIEYWLDVSTFDGDYGINDNPWTLSMGDNTGYGFHADFINGWEVGKLQAAMKTCMVGNTAEPLDSNTCFGAGALYDENTSDNCRVKNIVDEDVGLAGGEQSIDNNSATPKTHGGILPHLPGCNPIQPGPQLATVQTGCTYSLPTGFGSGAALGSQSIDGTGSANASSAAPVASTGTPVQTSPTTMATSASTTASIQPSGSSMVVQPLTNTAIMPIATATSQSSTTSAIGSPSESAISTGSTSAGSSSSGSSLTASDGSTWDLTGCYTDQMNPVRSLGSSPEWWGQPITASNCVDRCSKLGMPLSGTENSGQCFCGADLIGSKKVDSSECKAHCEGDSSQTCGGPARLSLYKNSSAGSKKHRSKRHLARHLEVVS